MPIEPRDQPESPPPRAFPASKAERAALLADVALSMGLPASEHPLQGREAIASVEHPGGGGGDRAVLITQMSRGGIGVIVAGYLHANTACKLTLRARDGRDAVVPGSVTSCRFVSGRYHLADIVFAQPVDLRRFADVSAADELIEPVDAAAPLRGRMLHVSEDPIQARLIAMHLREIDLELVCCDSVGDAADRIQLESFDAVLVEETVGEFDLTRTTPVLRRAGFVGPVIGSVHVSDEKRTAEIFAAGVAEIVLKPVLAKPLIEALRDTISRSADPLASSDPIRSSLESDKTRLDYVVEYIDELQRFSGELQQAITRDDYPAARRICLAVGDSAASFGFDLLGDATAPIVTALDACCSAQEAAADVRKLIRLIDRVVRPGGDDADECAEP